MRRRCGRRRKRRHALQRLLMEERKESVYDTERKWGIVDDD